VSLREEVQTQQVREHHIAVVDKRPAVEEGSLAVEEDSLAAMRHEGL
jgi:hypothetical protein